MLPAYAQKDPLNEYKREAFDQHLLEQVKCFPLIFIQRVLLSISAQADALPKMIKRQQMLFPYLVKQP